jgi:hypothetical protein
MCERGYAGNTPMLAHPVGPLSSGPDADGHAEILAIGAIEML